MSGPAKKGVFTSREQGGAEPPIIIRRQDGTSINSQYINGPVFDNYGYFDPSNRQPMNRRSPEEIRVPSNSHHIFIPPPPQRFLVESGHTNPSHHSQLPIQSTHIQSIQTVQPLFQSIKKTFIPHHIYNQIPIANSETKRYQIPEGNHEDFNEFEGPMLQQYEKLYAQYQEERKKRQQLERELNEIQMREKEDSGDYNRSKRIDPKLLSALLLKKHAAYLRDIMEHRKSQCINKLRGLFSQEKINFETVLVQTSQESTRNVRRS